MNLDEKKQRVIETLALHYNFEVLDSEEMGGDEREISLDFNDPFEITDIKHLLDEIGVNTHVVGCSHIILILIDVKDPHIVSKS